MDLDVHGRSAKKMTSEISAASSGVFWTSLSQAVRIACQLTGIMVLARFLPASDFGLIAMASIATGFMLLFRDFGTSAALIQKKQLNDDFVDSIFWFNSCLGGALALLLLILAPVIAKFFEEQELETIIWALAVIFPVSSLGIVHQALLEKVSRFRPIALVESAGSVIGIGAAVFGAVSGWGVYSLVAQSISSAVTISAGLWLVSKWRPRRPGSFVFVANFWKFSRNLVSFNVFNYVARNADNLIIGKFLGSGDLGIYSVAYRLMLWPIQNISVVVSRALFPVFSRMQDDGERIAYAYAKTTAAITLISAPLMLGLFAIREPFVLTVLGAKWLPVSDVLFWLAPVGLIQSISATVGPIYMATGRTDRLFQWGLLSGTVTTIAFVIGINWGLRGLVIAYFTAMCLLFVPSLLIPIRLIGSRLSILFARLWQPVIFAAAMAFLLAVVDVLFAEAWSTEFIRLLSLMIVGVVFYGMLMIAFQRPRLQEIKVAFRQVGG